MPLFSWFISNKKQGRIQRKVKVISFEQEIDLFKSNTMWPIAKVRKNSDEPSNKSH